MQARNLCRKARAKTREEVFVGAMLMNFAELIVLSTLATNVNEMADLYFVRPTRKEKDPIGRKHIGFSDHRWNRSVFQKMEFW